MSRDYAHEDWIPWYTRDTAGWLELSLAARGAAEGIARKMGRDRDELHLGSRGLRGLARMLGCSWEELEPALAELLAPGPDGEPPRLVHDRERGVLRDPDATARRRPTSTARVRSHRAKSGPPSAPQTETRETVSSVSSCSETGSGVPSLSDLDLRSDLRGEPERGPDPPAPSHTRPVADPQQPPPDWWAGALETIHTDTGVALPKGEAWLRYAGHRGEKRGSAERGHAIYWLTTVMVREARDALSSAARQRERDAKFDRARAGPEPPPKPTAAESKAFAAELAKRMAARKGAA